MLLDIINKCIYLPYYIDTALLAFSLVGTVYFNFQLINFVFQNASNL